MLYQYMLLCDHVVVSLTVQSLSVFFVHPIIIDGLGILINKQIDT